MNITKTVRQAGQRLGRLGLRLLAGARDLMPEACGVAGAALLYVGIHDIYLPAARITLGLLLLLVAWRLALAQAADSLRQKAKEPQP